MIAKAKLRKLFESVLDSKNSIFSLELLNKFNSEFEKYLGFKKYDAEKMGDILTGSELEFLKKKQDNRCADCHKVIAGRAIFYVKGVTNRRKRKMLCSRCYKKMW